MSTISKRDQIWGNLRDPEYRKQTIDEHINVGLAFQIRGLRIRQKLSQAKLAELLGDKSKQPLISEWEDPNYGKYTLKTLRALAKAFDVGLLVRFVPFSKLVDWTVDLTKDVIAPPSFSEEQDHIANTYTLQIAGAVSFMKHVHVDANKAGAIASGLATTGQFSVPSTLIPEPYEPYESKQKDESKEGRVEALVA